MPDRYLGKCRKGMANYIMVIPFPYETAGLPCKDYASFETIVLSFSQSVSIFSNISLASPS